jgi:hypothetical protein
MIDVLNGADVDMGLPVQIDPDWKVNHTKQTNPSKWIITNHTSLSRSGPRSTHMRVKVAMNLAHRIPAKRWRLGRWRHRCRERMGPEITTARRVG